MEYKFSVHKVSILPKKKIALLIKKKNTKCKYFQSTIFFATREKDTTLSPKLLGDHHFINFR